MTNERPKLQILVNVIPGTLCSCGICNRPFFTEKVGAVVEGIGQVICSDCCSAGREKLLAIAQRIADQAAKTLEIVGQVEWPSEVDLLMEANEVLAQREKLDQR